MQWLQPFSSLHSNYRANQKSRRANLAILLSAGLAIAFSQQLPAQADGEWANWRGPQYNGASETATPPTVWSQDKNIEWKIALAGRGSSTPIVWNDQVIIHTARAKEANPDSSTTEAAVPIPPNPEIKAGEQSPPQRNRGPGGPGGPGRNRLSSQKPTQVHEFIVSSYDLTSGKLNWQTVVKEEVPHEGGHSTNTFASSSPVTDGKHIYSFFGSRGVFCLNMEGKVLWQADLGNQNTRNEFGEAASAALYDGRVVIQWDHEGDSFLAALDAASGDLKWKTPREERTTWCTPLITKHNGVTQVITNGRKIRSYDLETGKLIWQVGQLTENPIPSPMLYKDYVIATTGFRGAACYAISLDAKGELDEESEYIKWTYHQNTPYVPSPVLYKDQLYFLSENKAILSCIDANTGKPIFARTRLSGLETIYSSIGAAGDKIFVTGRNGTTVVLKAGTEKEVLATNELGEEIDASPVFVGDRLLLRSDKHLYSIREQK